MKLKWLILSLFLSRLFANENTVGLISSVPDRTWDGMTLFAPTMAKEAYLIDINGREVHQWNLDYFPGQAVYLEHDGHLLATGMDTHRYFGGGGKGGVIQEYDWEGNVIWSFCYASSDVCQHHDVERMPNGNILIIAWESKTRAEAIQAGRNPSTIRDGVLWPDHLIEVDRAGTIVWEWHVWDHLIQDYDPGKDHYGRVADHPERIDLNYMSGNGRNDWTHFNSVDYHPELDQIIVSVHEFSEIWIIEHTENSELAAGHTGGRYGKGGDLLYRWGNPAAFKSGNETDRTLFQQHDAHWIPENLEGAGHLLIFNNGGQRTPVSYSSVDEIWTPLNQDGTYDLTPGSFYAPFELFWTYTADPPESFMSSHISGAQRLPNGNTLICAGAFGQFIEVTPDNKIVWNYINPVTDEGVLNQGESTTGRTGRGNNPVFRCYRYQTDGPELAGLDLTPGDYIENYETAGIDQIPDIPENPALDPCFPNPFNHSTRIRYHVAMESRVRLTVHNARGQQVATLVDATQPAGDYTQRFDAENLATGLYFIRISMDAWTAEQKMLYIR